MGEAVRTRGHHDESVRAAMDEDGARAGPESAIHGAVPGRFEEPPHELGAHDFHVARLEEDAVDHAVAVVPRLEDSFALHAVDGTAREVRGDGFANGQLGFGDELQHGALRAFRGSWGRADIASQRAHFVPLQGHRREHFAGCPLGGHRGGFSFVTLEDPTCPSPTGTHGGAVRSVGFLLLLALIPACGAPPPAASGPPPAGFQPACGGKAAP